MKLLIFSVFVFVLSLGLFLSSGVYAVRMNSPPVNNTFVHGDNVSINSSVKPIHARVSNHLPKTNQSLNATSVYRRGNVSINSNVKLIRAPIVNYVSENGQKVRVQRVNTNRTKIEVDNFSAECNNCELSEKMNKNKTRLYAKMGNGKNAEIKVMPSVASERAIERLRLKVCSNENNCSVQLKEVSSGNNSSLAYEVKARKHVKFLGLFDTDMDVQAQVNAETGEIINVEKPWWAFLVSNKEA